MALKSGRVGIHPSQVDPITGMLIGGTGGASIDDTSVSTETTWSSNKINSELSGKQDELTAGSNITIQNNVISSTASGGVLPLIKITAEAGLTVTLTKGQTVITASEISSGSYEAEVPEFGTYTVSDGTDSTTVTVDTVKIYEVEIIPTPSVISVTLTLYSATEDQVTVVDEDGTHLEQFASGQSSKSITVKVLADGSNVTFTSSIAKNPSDLSEYYSKTVTITSATTEVYLMPDNVLYWWGYEDTTNLKDMSTANGWSGSTMVAPTRGTLAIDVNSPSGGFSGVYTASKQTGTFTVIYEGKNKINPNFGDIQTRNEKNNGDAYMVQSISFTDNLNVLAKKSITNTDTERYINVSAFGQRRFNLYAFYKE